MKSDTGSRVRGCEQEQYVEHSNAYFSEACSSLLLVFWNSKIMATEGCVGDGFYVESWEVYMAEFWIEMMAGERAAGAIGATDWTLPPICNRFLS
jgi:hypothetical protein